MLMRKPIVAPSANSTPRSKSKPIPLCVTIAMGGISVQTANPNVKAITTRIIFGSAGDARTGAVATSPPTLAITTNIATNDPTSGGVTVSS